MQQKRQRFAPVLILLLFVGVLATGGVLMFKDIPAPSQPVEKQLDAKTFGAGQ